jgi:hypothetical protein
MKVQRRGVSCQYRCCDLVCPCFGVNGGAGRGKGEGREIGSNDGMEETSYET